MNTRLGIVIAGIVLAGLILLLLLPTSFPPQTMAGKKSILGGAFPHLSLELAFPHLSFDRMVYLTSPGDGTNRLFIVLQPGEILVFSNRQDVDSAAVFLNIRDRVNSSGNEEGLLGLAFDPDYEENGYLYVYYSASPPRRSIVSRFSVNSNDAGIADHASELVILEVLQPFSNHNGGNLVFGPDDYLYVGMGDGGSGGDPHENGQNRSTLLGSILRIDVSYSSPAERYRIPSDNPFVGLDELRGEIWAYGLRNPWRFSFDTKTDQLWAGDVGQDLYEEVDGWNIMEGLHCFPPSVSDCNEAGMELPVVEYTHRDGCSVTGGHIYHGDAIESLQGSYIYGDFCSGKIWAFRFDGSNVTNHTELIDSDLQISSFGVDDDELFILSFNGKIYRFALGN